MLGLSYKHKNGSRSLNSIGTYKVNRDITHNVGKKLSPHKFKLGAHKLKLGPHKLKLSPHKLKLGPHTQA